MIEMMLLALAVTLGPALGLYFLFGRPLKGLIVLACLSVGVVRVCWLNPHATEKMLLVGLC